MSTLFPTFPLAPRYRLDDEQPWLQGVDPSRQYWVAVNGDRNLTAIIPGVSVTSVAELKQIIRQFRQLSPGESLRLKRISGSTELCCVSANCYAIVDNFRGHPVWHLFDQDAIESLLRTAHPDWQCSDRDLELGRRQLQMSLGQTQAA